MIDNRESNFVSAIVYLGKEDTNCISFFNMLAKQLINNFKKSEIICVNDNISDMLLEALKKEKEKYSDLNVSIINMGFEHGLEASMNAGLDLSIGDFVFEFNSCYIDYDEQVIMDVYKKALIGYDIVYATPPKNSCKKSSLMFYSLYNKYSNSNYEIKTERFSIISRRAINRVKAYSKTIPYRKAVYASSGLKEDFVEFEPLKNVSGKLPSESNKNNKAIDALVLFTNVSFKLSITFTIFMLLLMFGTVIYTIVTYFGTDKPVEGWAPIMGIVSVGFFALFLILSVIIKYLDVLLMLIFKKQKYMISSIEKL